MRFALPLLVLVLAVPSASAALLPAEPQLVAVATPGNDGLADFPLVHATTLRVESAGVAHAVLTNVATGAVVADITVTGAGSVSFPAVSGTHSLRLVLVSGASAAATVEDESVPSS